MGTDPPVGEIPQGFSPPVGEGDDGNGPQMSTAWDMGVYTHQDGAENGGAGGDRGVYCLMLEHGRTVHCDLSYHRILYGGRAELRTTPIQAMVGAARSG